MLKFYGRGGADCIVFNKFEEYSKNVRTLFGAGCARSQVMSVKHFKASYSSNFYNFDADIHLMIFLKSRNVRTLLDFDAHFAKSPLFILNDDNSVEIDCITENEIPLIKENIYNHVYKKFSNCCFKHYDAVLLEEKSPLEFDRDFAMIENSADLVITFIKYGSELRQHIIKTQQTFSQIVVFESFGGEWFILYRHKPPEDFAMYVITHKALPPEHVEKFPEGYKVIHAGRTLSQDLGYIGDNTGDNISHLNPYINEITALYWIWKNTSHTVVATSHYRRFFNNSDKSGFSYDQMLTKDQALKLLENYDIALVGAYDFNIQIECIFGNVDMKEQVVGVIKKNLSKFCPEYLEAFDYIMNSTVYFNLNMFVTRKFVFDAYCNWLFSFYLDTVSEILRDTQLANLDVTPKRILGYFAERMPAVWLLKNNLRIKGVHMMQVPGM